MSPGPRRRLLLGASVCLVVALAFAFTVGRAPPAPPRLLELISFVPPEAETTRFVAFGDQGKGNERQRAVGEAVGRVCDERGGCAFGLLLGDNFYPSGVSSVDDPQWRTAFEEPYATLTFPFWVALGNHDYGAKGRGWEFWRVQPQLDYAAVNPKWKMPARDYAFTAGVVDVFVVDTTEVFWGKLQEQSEALRTRLERSRAPWRIVAGHHPLVSNGAHGNAGHYDRVPFALPASGAPVKAFLEAEVCGKADLYLAGHDHNMQDVVSPCETQMLVSGAGSSTTRLRGSNATHFQSDASGFVLLTATRKTLSFEFFDADGERLHARTLTR